jgi:hypothetical protein
MYIGGEKTNTPGTDSQLSMTRIDIHTVIYKHGDVVSVGY